MSELKPQGSYTTKRMQQSARIASTADGIEISGNMFKVTELQACPDMLLFACERIKELESQVEFKIKECQELAQACNRYRNNLKG